MTVPRQAAADEHGPRHSRRIETPRHDRPNGPHNATPHMGGSRGPRDPRQAPIPTAGPTTEVVGVVDLTEGAGGYLRQVAQNYLPFRDDAIVPAQVARDHALRDGTEIEGLARDAGGGRRVVVEITRLAADPRNTGPAQCPDRRPQPARGVPPVVSKESLRIIALISPTAAASAADRLAAEGGNTTLLDLGQAIAKHIRGHLILLLID